MAKKGGTKGSVSYDYHNLKPEQRAKVNALSETYPEAQKEHIAIVLQYYEFDQDLATNALTTDGGTDALNNFNMNSENNQAKTLNRNKKKNKKKNRRDNLSNVGIAAQGTDAEDSSSLHSSNIDFDGEKESSSKLDYCDELAGKGDRDILNMCNSAISSSCNELEVPVTENECSALDDRVETPEEGKSDDGLLPSLEVDFSEENISENVERLNPKEQHSEEHTRHQPLKHLARQRHGSYHSKSSSLSEEPSSAPQTSNALKNRSYAKHKKDLSRQTVFLQNIQLKLESKLDEAGKCLKNTFAEVRNLLDKRQAEVEAELDKTKQESLKLLKSRQDLAMELKLRVDRASTTPDSEWTDLRNNIKLFVTERKYDELLGKTTWFVWSRDGIIEEINKFGEIAPVKNVYSQRNLNSRNQSSPEPNQLDSDVKNEDNELHEHADTDNPVPNFGHDVGDTKMEKEVSTKMNQGENRSRVFCNRQFNRQNHSGGNRFNHNRGGRGFFRQRGNVGGYPRGRPYESYRQYGGERYDYRPQQYSQDRMDYRHNSTEEKSAEPRVSNVNDGNNAASAPYGQHPRDHQEHGRNQERRPFGGGYRGGGGYHKSYNNNFQRNRGPNKPHRPHAEAVIGGEEAVGDGNANYDQASNEKPDLVNGY